MNNDIIDRYNKVKMQRSKLQGLSAELKELDKRIYTNELVNKRLKAALDKEYKEYKNMEDKTLVSMFYSMLGNIEEKIEKEKKEYIEAKFEYEQAIKEKDMLLSQAEELKQKISIIGNAEEEYEKLKAEREEYLSSGTDEAAKEYQVILEQVSELEIIYNNTEELYQLASLIQKAIEKVKGLVNSAENWATYGMVGGGTYSTATKHAKIADAQMQIIILKYEANNFLQRYNNTTLNISNELKVGGGLLFADFMLDSLFVDYMVFDRITSMKHHIGDIESSFRKIGTELYRRKQEILKAKEELSKKLE